MKPRYQVFISSTYLDLKEERAAVMKAVLKLRLMPAGMEWFTAFDSDQFEYIKRVIDDSDYYVLVIGNRYGTETAEGLSYTEKEFDYAVSKGLKVMAFLHESPGDLSSDKSDKSSRQAKKLAAFREKSRTGRLVEQWSNKDQLAGLVTASLAIALQEHDAVGWVRANEADNTKLLTDLNDLRKQNEQLRKQRDELAKSQGTLAIQDLAGLEEEFVISGAQPRGNDHYYRSVAWECRITWIRLFCLIAPELMNGLSEGRAIQILSEKLKRYTNPDIGTPILDKDTCHTIRLQFMAHRLIESKGDAGMYWKLTEKGRQIMFRERTVKAAKPKDKSL